MKRDMELIRKMVLALEDEPTGFAPRDLNFPGYTSEQIGYHAHLLIEGGYAKGFDATNHDSSGPEAVLTSLTWKGHEFVDAARDESRWKKATGIVKEKSGSVTIDVLTQLLVELMKRTIGLP